MSSANGKQFNIHEVKSVTIFALHNYGKYLEMKINIKHRMEIDVAKWKLSELSILITFADSHDGLKNASLHNTNEFYTSKSIKISNKEFISLFCVFNTMLCGESTWLLLKLFRYF